VVVIPAYHQGVEAQDSVYDAFVAIVHKISLNDQGQEVINLQKIWEPGIKIVGFPVK
jgi:hypothetical protein